MPNNTINPDAFNLPLVFKPIYHEKIWGGRRLRNALGRQDASEDAAIGESWEITARDDNDSVVATGALAGRTLNSIWKTRPQDLLGAASAPERFPLLVKLIDADQDLSVQVHPDDAYAATHANDLGKAEAWVVIRAEPGAKIQRGLKPGISREDFRRALDEKKLIDCLHFIDAKPGMVLAQPSGCVHAIGSGVLLAEIQQNSDVTYRVYDYDRLGLDGKPRALHVEDALNVIGFDRLGNEFDGDMSQDIVKPTTLAESNGIMIEKLLTGSKFSMARITIKAGKTMSWPAGMPDGLLSSRSSAGSKPKSAPFFQVWMVVKGQCVVSSKTAANAEKSLALAATISALVPSRAIKTGLSIRAETELEMIVSAPTGM